MLLFLICFFAKYQHKITDNFWSMQFKQGKKHIEELKILYK